MMNMIENIKKGFFIGIGLLIPLLVLEVAVTYASFAFMANGFEDIVEDLEGFEDFETDTDDDSSASYEDALADINRSFEQDVKITSFETLKQGTQVLVRGQIKNNADIALNSIKLEAELFDKDDKFVYECSEYINSKQEPKAELNFMIRCGCSSNGVPEFDTVKVSVTDARSY